MDVRRKEVKRLTPLERSACLAWTFNTEDVGIDGMMENDFYNAEDNGYGEVVMLWKSPRSRTVQGLVGWVLLLPVRPYAEYSWGTEWTRRVARYTTEFYVRPEYRCQGYGTKLMTIVKEKYDPRPHVMPHDETSGEFFSKFDVTLTNEDRRYMKRKVKVA